MKKTIYTNNRVSDQLIEEVKEALKEYDTVEVSFDVTGRTMHQMLSNQLADKMPDYKFEIDYNYVCIVKNK